jgi:hypothetical protein
VQLPVGQLSEVAQNGSPVLLQAVGRVFGLGEAERGALFANGLPRWSMYVLLATAGVVAGVYIHKRWPRQIDRVIGS